MTDGLFETEESIRERVATELERLAREFERDYSDRAALRFAASFVRGEDVRIGPIAMGWFVPVDRSLVIQLIEGATTLDAARDRLRDALAQADERVAWENRKLTTWTAEVARGQRRRT